MSDESEKLKKQVDALLGALVPLQTVVNNLSNKLDSIANTLQQVVQAHNQLAMKVDAPPAQEG